MLRLEQISLTLGAFVLEQVNFHIQPGEYRVLIGPTGTGKTVLLETIAGLHQPGQGTIFLDGQVITALTPERRNIGVVYQHHALFPHLNVADNIGFGLRIRGEDTSSIQKKIDAQARFLHISHLLHRWPANLSGGESQRVALARALILHPRMLLLDEPLSSVDRQTQEHLQAELKRLHQELGLTILHITHDLREAFFLADRITVMQHGTVAQEGTPEELVRHPATRFVAELMGYRNLLPVRRLTDGSMEVQGLGTLPAAVLQDCPAHDGAQLVLAIPEWCIALFPDNPEQCWWTGEARLVRIHPTGQGTSVLLELPGGMMLQSFFSTRETAGLGSHLVAGRTVLAGIGQQGMHLVQG